MLPLEGRGADMECTVYNREDYGGYWRRSFADFIDITLLSIAFTFVGATMQAGWLLKLIIFLAYMIGFKMARRATPGYMILGMHIVSINNTEVTVIQIVVRLISSFFSAIVFGAGFIAIAFDKNRQAWHDKIAGTYVIRTGAYHLYKTEISRSNLIDFRVFAFVILGSCLIPVVFAGGLMYLMRGNDAYKLSQKCIVENPLIQEKVGSPIKFGWFPAGNVNISGESGEANYEIHVSGDKGEVTVFTVLEKKSGRWTMIEVGCIDKDGNYIDISKPLEYRQE